MSITRREFVVGAAAGLILPTTLFAKEAALKSNFPKREITRLEPHEPKPWVDVWGNKKYTYPATLKISARETKHDIWTEYSWVAYSAELGVVSTLSHYFQYHHEHFAKLFTRFKEKMGLKLPVIRHLAKDVVFHLQSVEVGETNA